MSHLFDMAEVKKDSPRLVSIKEADIQTHHAPHEEFPWIAIPMKAAKLIVGDKADDGSDLNTIFDICASFCRVLDDQGLVFYGESESEVQDMALSYVKGGEA